MPYDINKTPLGFVFVLAGQQVGEFSACMSATLSITVHVTLIFYVVAAISDLQMSMRKLNELLTRDGLNNSNEATIYCQLIETLGFHRWIIRYFP